MPSVIYVTQMCDSEPMGYGDWSLLPNGIEYVMGADVQRLVDAAERYSKSDNRSGNFALADLRAALKILDAKRDRVIAREAG